MGMIMVVRLVDDTTLAAVRARPALMDSILHESEGGSDATEIDLDKTWHGIHFLLSGDVDGLTDDPLGFLLGGEPLGEDFGYGPARVFSPDEVVEIHEALAEVRPESLASRYDPEAMRREEIYPSIWDNPDDDALAYILDGFVRLQDGVREAASGGRGLIIAVM